MKITPKMAARLSQDPHIRFRQLLWCRLNIFASYQRLYTAWRYLEEGWADVFFVGRVDRGSPSPDEVPIADRRQYTIEVRPAKAGRWSTPRVERAIKDAKDQSRLEDELRCLEHDDCADHPDIGRACLQDPLRKAL
jgi:hypothetical protein